ncbi:RDD family protein [Vibrio sp. AND4]|uniref:RDD family protein n=1 Tax=Vibrio sp. AND4 TaxID=314289 RepID=UPI00015F355D|nr:RDD family protein [Vibrio sp. AND4]EDP59551.1 predicted membrane protein/domain [Vibrio sp. AND4]
MNDNAPTKMSDLYEYSGFWPRVGASLIDTVIICTLTYPILVAVYGWAYFESDDLVQGVTDLMLSWIFPLLAIIGFWLYRQATPGKIAISARIVDAKTGEKPTLRQCTIRYLGYFIAGMPLGLGILWVAWDRRKQGWHDKLANTVVISEKARKKTHEVEFS